MGKDKRYKRMGAALTTGHHALPCGKETCDGTKTKKARDATSRRSKATTTRKLPLLALALTGLIAAGKAAALGGVGAAAGYGVKKGLEAATRRRGRR